MGCLLAAAALLQATNALTITLPDGNEVGFDRRGGHYERGSWWKAYNMDDFADLKQEYASVSKHKWLLAHKSNHWTSNTLSDWEEWGVHSGSSPEKPVQKNDDDYLNQNLISEGSRGAMERLFRALPVTPKQKMDWVFKNNQVLFGPHIRKLH